MTTLTLFFGLVVRFFFFLTSSVFNLVYYYYYYYYYYYFILASVSLGTGKKKLYQLTSMGPQIVWKILSDGNWVMMPNGCKKLSDEWWVMKIEWWKKWSQIAPNVSRDSVWWLVRGWKVQSQGDSEIFAAYLMTLSWVELPAVKNT